MPHRGFVRTFAAVAASFACLYARPSGAATQTAAGRPPAATLYAGGPGPIVNAYSPDLHLMLPIGQLPLPSGYGSYPQGVGVDRGGNVWVAVPDNTNGVGPMNYVAEFPAGSGAPSFTIRLPDSDFPYYVTVDNERTVYVASASKGNGPYSTTVGEYASGMRTPFRSIVSPEAIGGIAVDCGDDLYIDYQTASGAGRISYVKAGTDRGKDLGIALTSPGGVAIDPSGNVVALDQAARSVNIYAPGATAPERVIRINALIQPLSVGINAIALDPQGSRLYVAVGGGFYGPSGIYVYDYQTGVQIGDILAGFPASYEASGLAVSPAPCRRSQ